MALIKLNNAVYICEDIGVRCNIVSNDNNDNPISALIISVHNDRILIANDGVMYYIIINYYKDNIRHQKKYYTQQFTGDNLRAFLHMVSGQPIHEVDDAGNLDQFFDGLN